MKRTVPSLVCAAFCLCGVSSAFSESPLELIDRAQKSLQTHLETARKEQAAKLEATKDRKPGATDRELEAGALLGGMTESYALQNASQTLAQIRDALVSDQDGELAQVLRQISATNLTLPDDVRKDLDTLVQTLRKDQTEREETCGREVDAACKRAGEILLKASEPKELDKPLQELTQLAAKPLGRNRYNGGDSGLSNKLQAAVQFVNHWQDYLLAKSRNNEEAQRNALRNLADSSNSNQVALVPRSEILSRMPTSKETGDNAAGSSRRPARTQAQLDADAMNVLQGVKTLDDLSAALTKLIELRKELASQPSYSFRSDSDLGAATTGLQNLMRTRLEIQNGLATNITLSANRAGDFNSRPDLENALFPLRVELVKLAIPRILGAAGDEKPAANEALDAFLRRMIEVAKGRKDWAAVVRGLEIKNTLASSSATPYALSNNQELEAFKSFFAANNLETAGQYEQAVASYLTALRSGQADLPSSLIGEHLAVIEKEHPAAYASGKEFVLNPPRSPYGDGFRSPFPPGMVRGGYDPRLPGAPGNPGAVGETKLPVPAASPSATVPPVATVSPAPAPTTNPKAP